jgi:hypothetical protein
VSEQNSSAEGAVAEALEELRRAICAIKRVGAIDGRDVVRQGSVLDIIDQRRAALAHPAVESCASPAAAGAQEGVPANWLDSIMDRRRANGERRWTTAIVFDALKEAYEAGRATHPTPAQAAPQAETLTLTISELADALGAAGGANADDATETEVTLTRREAFTSTEGEAMGAGLYLHFTEYPEEGVNGPLGVGEVAPLIITKLDPGFRWDSEALHHIPSLLVEFEPVATGKPNDARGWHDRDALAAMLNAGRLASPAAVKQSLTAASGLTDEQIAEVARTALGYDGGFQTVHSGDLRHFARAILAAGIGHAPGEKP